LCSFRFTSVVFSWTDFSWKPELSACRTWARALCSTALTSSTAAQSANYPFCTIEPNEGIVSVPDERLQRITKYIPPQKVIPAALKLVDIAGIVKGASEGEGLGNKFLSHIREVDAIMQVVRCFVDDDITHVSGAVNPMSDIEIIETELLLADMQSLETSLPRPQRSAKSGDKAGKAASCGDGEVSGVGEQQPAAPNVYVHGGRSESCSCTGIDDCKTGIVCGERGGRGFAG
jgi:hypothetical protein